MIDEFVAQRSPGKQPLEKNKINICNLVEEGQSYVLYSSYVFNPSHLKLTTVFEYTAQIDYGANGKTTHHSHPNLWHYHHRHHPLNRRSRCPPNPRFHGLLSPSLDYLLHPVHLLCP